MPIDESAIAGQKMGTFARYALVRMPSSPGRVVAGLERAREIGDPLVVRAELLFARVGVVDAVDAVVRQRRVVGVRRSDIVMLPTRFVQIVVEVRARRDETIDVAVQNQVRDNQTQAARRQRAGHPEKDGDIVLQHLVPDRMRGGEIASLKRDALHARDYLIRSEPGLDDERLDRRLQESGFLLHAQSIKSQHAEKLFALRFLRVSR